MASVGRFAMYAGMVPDTRFSLKSISDKYEQLVKVADKVVLVQGECVKVECIAER